MIVKPLQARVLVRLPEEKEEITVAGIILTPRHPNPARKALVVAIGKDVKEVKVGDTVAYVNYDENRTIKIDGVKHDLLAEDDLLYVEEP